jgi:hypothetical protein
MATDLDRVLLMELVDSMADLIDRLNRRSLALQQIMERAKLTTAEEVAAKMQAFDDADDDAIFEVRIEFRRLRGRISPPIAAEPGA